MVKLARRFAIGLAAASVGACVVAACAAAPQPALIAPVERPATTTSDGHVLGADEKSPERAMAEGATTGHLAPGWTAGDKGLKYDPKRDPAGPDDGATRLEHVDGGAEIVPPPQK